MAKLYEILYKKLAGEGDKPEEIQEDKIYNPLRARVGNAVSVDSLEYGDLNFFVRSIREVALKPSGSKTRFVDYDIVARPLEGDDVVLRLRIIPTAKALDGSKFQILILNLLVEEEYNQEVYDIVQDGSGVFNLNWPDKGIDNRHYQRVGDVRKGYKANTLTLQDENNDGKISANEVQNTGTIDFWDYTTKLEVEGVSEDNFMFVEMDSDTKWMWTWLGQPISPHRVEIL